MKNKAHFTVPFILIVILALGFYLRYESVSQTKVIKPLRADAGQYFMYAYNLRHKDTYSHQTIDFDNPDKPVRPDAVRSPGYPLFLSIFIDGLPNEEMLSRILFWQVIISTATILFTFLLFQNLLHPFWALGACLLTALSPHLIVACGYILTETLFCFLLVMLGWLTAIFFKRESLWLGSIIGFVMGIATLVRPGLQYFSVVLAIFLLCHYGWKVGGRYAAVILIGFSLGFFPWIARNIVTLGKPTDQRLVVNFLHHGMYPDFMYKGITKSYGYPYRYDPKTQEIAKDIPSVLDEIANRFKQSPLRCAKWYLLQKPVVFWSWNMIQGFGGAFVYPVSNSPYFDNSLFRITQRTMYALHYPILLLALFGSIIIWLPQTTINMEPLGLTTARFCSLVLIYYTLIHMAGAPFPRYSVPLRPFLFGMAFLIPCYLPKILRQNTARKAQPETIPAK